MVTRLPSCGLRSNVACAVALGVRVDEPLSLDVAGLAPVGVVLFVAIDVAFVVSGGVDVALIVSADPVLVVLVGVVVVVPVVVAVVPVVVVLVVAVVPVVVVLVDVVAVVPVVVVPVVVVLVVAVSVSVVSVGCVVGGISGLSTRPVAMPLTYNPAAKTRARAARASKRDFHGLR